MKKRFFWFLVILVLSSCQFPQVPQDEGAIDITEVSLDWSETTRGDVEFRVVNTGNVDLDSILIYFTAECVDGDFDDAAGFPNFYYAEYEPIGTGGICYAFCSFAILTGGALRIVVTRVYLWYGETLKTIDYSKVFTKP